MNVGRAIAIFSPPVTAALTFLSENSNSHPKAYEFRNASSTILFMRNVYKWFTIHDIANCHQYIVSRNENRMHFFSLTDERLKWLENDFLQFMGCIKQSSADEKMQYLSKETHEALTLTTLSTTNCIKYLLDSGYHYILTRTFNSDPIESLFLALRQMNGGNDVMDVRTTLLSLEKILKTGQLLKSKHSNARQSYDTISGKDTKIIKGSLPQTSSYINPLPRHILQILDHLTMEQGKSFSMHFK